MLRQDNYLGFVEQFIKIFLNCSAMENATRDFGTGEELYAAEIHMIEAIGKNPGINITQLSELLHVTKGAVSQNISRLEEKKYLRKIKNSSNNKEVIPELTEKGKKAYEGHIKFHSQIYELAYDEFKGLTLEQLLFLSDVLERVNNIIVKL